jgi:Rrf2 family transcriptional regulator, repressor of oqxAB
MSTKSPIGPAWFWVAVQALVVLSEAERACPSTTIAQDLNTHAVFLRRVMAQLVRAEIVEAREGRDGGYRLARPAGQITLADVFTATGTMNQSEEEDCVRRSKRVDHDVLARVKQDLEYRYLEVLGHYTIESLIQRS